MIDVERLLRRYLVVGVAAGMLVTAAVVGVVARDGPEVAPATVSTAASRASSYEHTPSGHPGRGGHSSGSGRDGRRSADTEGSDQRSGADRGTGSGSRVTYRDGDVLVVPAPERSGESSRSRAGGPSSDGSSPGPRSDSLEEDSSGSTVSGSDDPDSGSANSDRSSSGGSGADRPGNDRSGRTASGERSGGTGATSADADGSSARGSGSDADPGTGGTSSTESNGTPSDTGDTGSTAQDITGTGTTAAERFGWGTPDREDDFDGGMDQWSIYDGPGHAGKGRRTPDAVSIQDGIMTITGDEDGNTAGMAWNPGQKYGRWEARVKSPASADAYHSLLLLWPDAENFPVGGEIDFMEIGDPDRRSTDIFLHYGEDNSQVHGSLDIDATEWHNWAVEWAPERVTAYVDGEQWWETTDTGIFPPGPMHLCIQLDYFPGDGSAGGGGLEHVDWVRQYSLDGGATGGGAGSSTADRSSTTDRSSDDGRPSTAGGRPSGTRNGGGQTRDDGREQARVQNQDDARTRQEGETG
ncbi:family 16 glycosylhydrolase [Pseudonocardia sp.]|uniref:glycoside hydrolase family 16 protein n=1 Tax=Pseudonocardia sp. TaxID=60912 RepID=UPI0031FBCA7F